MKRNKKIKKVKKNCQLLVTFSILKIDQVFERVYDMLQLTSPLFSKNGGLFSKFSKECFTYLAVGASFFIFFLQSTIFYSCLFNQEIRLNAFQIIIFFFLASSWKSSFFFTPMNATTEIFNRTNEQMGVVPMNRISEISSR